MCAQPRGEQCQKSAGSSAAGGLWEFGRTSSAAASVLPEQHPGSLSALLDFALSSFASLFEHVPVASSHLPVCQCLKDVNPSLVDEDGDGIICHLTFSISNLLLPVKFQENSLIL